MIKLSVLDLMMIGEGKTFADALADAGMLARHVEQHGYELYWIAEHHDMPGVASSATVVLIGHLAAAIQACGRRAAGYCPELRSRHYAADRRDFGLGYRARRICH